MSSRADLVHLTRSGTQAAVAPRGASLRSLRVAGLDLVQPAPVHIDSALAAGVTLAPWPNRVRGARWRYRGGLQQLEVTEPDRGNALHGLVAADDFDVLHRGPAIVTLRTRITGYPGFPFDVELDVSYEAVDDGIRVAYTARNLGADPAPLALGAHPYLCVGSQEVTALRLEVPAQRTLLLDGDELPRDLADVEGSPFDLRHGAVVGRMPGHAVFTCFASRDHERRLPLPARHRLAGREGALELWADDRFRWLQVYRTDAFPSVSRSAGTVTALAVEPMTAPPDALNSGIDLEWVDPGHAWRTSWGVRRIR